MRSQGKYPRWRGMRALTMLASLAFLGGTTSQAASGLCVGDCNGDCEVAINEILTAVNIALGTADPSSCLAFFDSGGPRIPEVPDLIAAVNSALNGCDCAGGCGNGHVEGGEDCDDGGLCIGGANAGTNCTADSDCSGNGVCDDGSKLGYACTTDNDCPGSRCVRCKTFGGDGCAANCTLESDVIMPLVPGVAENITLQAGTSGFVSKGEVLSVPLPLQSGSQTITIGKPSGDGKIPLVIKAANVNIPRHIIVPTLIDACLRPVALQTCGGTIFESDGSASPSCTPGFPGAVACPVDRPCAFAHGPGNSASGFLACGPGLSGVDVNLTRDGNAAHQSPQVELTGSGPQGSAVLLDSFALGSADVPPTEGCTDDDPIATKGPPITVYSTTGTACCEVTNANMMEGDTIGPVCTAGRPFVCADLLSKPLTGGLVGAYPTLAEQTLYSDGAACLTMQLLAPTNGAH